MTARMAGWCLPLVLSVGRAGSLQRGLDVVSGAPVQRWERWQGAGAGLSCVVPFRGVRMLWDGGEMAVLRLFVLSREARGSGVIRLALRWWKESSFSNSHTHKSTLHYTHFKLQTLQLNIIPQTPPLSTNQPHTNTAAMQFSILTIAAALAASASAQYAATNGTSSTSSSAVASAAVPYPPARHPSPRPQAPALPSSRLAPAPLSSPPAAALRRSRAPRTSSLAPRWA
jgi:hypothetical protein